MNAAFRRDRPADAELGAEAWLWQRLESAWTRWRTWCAAPRNRRVRQAAVATVLQRLHALRLREPAPALLPAASALRAALRRAGSGTAGSGWPESLALEALTLAARAGMASGSPMPWPNQIEAAWLLLRGGAAEMATGEGKTYAAGLAALAAALAGQPLHLMTANDYLVERDAAALAPMATLLGLSVARIVAADDATVRRQAYRADIVVATARELAFDDLRDRLLSVAPGSPQAPVMRGLGMAIVDEADSLLVDEAAQPLLLSEWVAPTDAGDAETRAMTWQALALARGLVAGQDFSLDTTLTLARAELLPAGREQLAQRANALQGLWFNRRHRDDLITQALVALHLLQRDRDYLVQEGRVQLLDAHTGRAAVGRMWSPALQRLVEAKEGCRAQGATRTLAQSSLQRFFSRYLCLGALSGTLWECRAELRAVYGLDVVRVPLRRPCKRDTQAALWFANETQREAAVVLQVTRLHAMGRPVLVGVGRVDAAQRLTVALERAGIPCQRLDATQAAAESAIVAQAGQPGAVTVATQMAGRGTDITLGPGVAEGGGLHVLLCQDNPSARLDRQFIGRCARAGDPGSAQVWRVWGAEVWVQARHRFPWRAWWAAEQPLWRTEKGGAMHSVTPFGGLASLRSRLWAGCRSQRLTVQDGVDWASATRWCAWVQADQETRAAAQRLRSLEVELQWTTRIAGPGVE